MLAIVPMLSTPDRISILVGFQLTITIALLPVVNSACAESSSSREILRSQPDFMGEEIMSDFEPKIGAGFSASSQIAKRDGTYRRDNGSFIFLSKANQPTLRLSPKDKTYDKLLKTRNEQSLWYSGIADVEIFAQKNDLKFEAIGRAIVDGHDCTKIRAAPELRSSKDEEAAYFYAAKDLRNLVVKIELKIPWRTTVYALRKISFRVPDKLFEVPANYKPAAR
jgi:hypothetical protein